MFNCRRSTRALQVLFALLALSTLAVAQSNSLFTTLSLNPVGSGPVAIASGDFNGDGFPDRAVVNYDSNSVSILLGTGDGNFQPAVNYTVGGYPTAIVAGDFNRDGHLDLAVATYGYVAGSGLVSILLGRGDGTFAAGATYSMLGPEAIVTGDLDGDGKLDLAVLIDGYSGNLSVNILRGGGDGTFQTGKNYGVGTGIGLGAMAIGDFTGDGSPDLVVFSVAQGTSFIGTLVNDGSGGFTGKVGCTIGSQGRVALATGDFNNDGKLDLAVAIGTGSSIAICLGNGDGTFSLASSPTVGTNPIGLAAGDLNGDGKIDLVASNFTDGTVSVLLGKGDGTFTNSATYPIGKQPVDLALADLNGDGKLDVTVVNGADNNVQALLGRGDGTFFVGTYRVSASGSSQIASGDFNGDGIPDLAVFNLDQTVTVLLGDGRGGFRVSSTFLGCDHSAESPGQIVAADFDGDGKTDLATLCNGAGFSEFDEFGGKGDGSFQLEEYYLGSPIVAILASDLYGDRIAQLILVFFDDEVSCNIPSGDCLGILHTGENLGLKAGDFNGDGKVDFLVLQENNGEQTVALGDGTGNFQFFPLQQSADSALVGDFNGDGLSDIEFETAPGGVFQMQLSLSNGDGSFRNGFQYSSNRFGVPQAVADFNGDGILDLLTFGNGGPFGVFFGKDDGTFGDSGIPSIPFGASSAATIADFDGNGSPDVAIVDSTPVCCQFSSIKIASNQPAPCCPNFPGKSSPAAPLCFRRR
jgi:hypothetical protein